MSDSDDADILIAANEDGYRPPSDPDDWNRVYNIVTGEECPKCETALSVMLGPVNDVDIMAREMQDEYGQRLSADWADGYDNPVYLFCDRPDCSYQGVIDWSKLRPVLEVWIQGDAKTWRQRVENEEQK